MTEAAGRLVRERVKLAEQAVKSRDLNWSDDLGDRSARGRVCGGGLGVCLGIASKDVGGESKLSSEERTEAMLDLHGLHSNEATEVLEEFVLAVSVGVRVSGGGLTCFGSWNGNIFWVLVRHFVGHHRFCSDNFFAAYAIVGEEKHTGTQDAARGASRARLAAGVREWLHRWGYPWSDRDGIICIDPLTHS